MGVVGGRYSTNAFELFISIEIVSKVKFAVKFAPRKCSTCVWLVELSELLNPVVVDDELESEPKSPGAKLPVGLGSSLLKELVGNKASLVPVVAIVNKLSDGELLFVSRGNGESEPESEIDGSISVSEKLPRLRIATTNF